MRRKTQNGRYNTIPWGCGNNFNLMLYEQGSEVSCSGGWGLGWWSLTLVCSAPQDWDKTFKEETMVGGQGREIIIRHKLSIFIKLNSCTMEPRYNDPRYNDIPGITMNILCPGKSYSNTYGTETRFNDHRYNDIPDTTIFPIQR